MSLPEYDVRKAYINVVVDPAVEEAVRTALFPDRTQPLTAVEVAFFGIPKHMVVPPSDRDEESMPLRVHIEIHPITRERLRKVLLYDSRFNGIGYSEFLNRALDALGCED